MLWWLFVLALFYASARWTAVGKAVRAVLFCFAVVGLLMLIEVGFVPVLLQALIEIPINFVQAIVGLVAAILFSR